MIAVVGLGNIGNGFKNTYHNMGFMVADELAKRLNVKFDIDKCKASIAKTEYEGEEVLIVKPKTYMNNSGICVNEIMRKYKVKSYNIIVAVDDIDLECGKVRYRQSGSSGTHNGLRSIVKEIGKEDFKRVKIGVGRDLSMRLDEYVLSHIDPYKLQILKQSVHTACEMILDIIAKKSIGNETK